MATEDIRVEHNASAETASFDIKNRCLILPVWKDMSNSMYDMLVAHEVSHALNTPFDEWDAEIQTVENVGAFMQVANVVEDARIERMIKQRYPGVRKDFSRAYGELHASDLFELAGKDVAEMNLIDRLNIEFKLGLFGHVQVPFSQDEQQYVTRMANTQTFAEVVELAKELLADWELNNPQEAQQNQSGQGQGQDGQDQDGQGQDGQGQSDSGQGQGQDGQGQDGQGQEDQDGQGQGQGDSPMETTNIDDINGNNENGENGENAVRADGEDGVGSYDYDDYANNSGGLPSETQTAFEQSKRNQIDENGKHRDYHTLPSSMNLDEIIIDHKAIDKIWEDHVVSLRDRDGSESTSYEYEKAYLETKLEIDGKCDSFLNSKKAVVNHMVSQFMMKQSADVDRRTSIAKSGVLDTTAMMSYRWNEDIFQSNQVVSDGKNHGMVFFLDWSGSMGGIIQDTVEQLFILTEFCNKVNIPFEVYAFSDRDDLNTSDDSTEDAPQFNTKEGVSNQITPHTFSLLNFISSKMNRKEYRTAVRRLYMLATSRYGVSTPSGFGLGCTPLNEAIVTAFDLVPRFQEETGVQIVNAVFLTDGEGHGMGVRPGWQCEAWVHDPVTKKDYLNSFKETNLYLEILKDRTGCNTIGIFLSQQRSMNSLRYSYFTDDDIAGACASWKKSNYAVASEEKTGYDECYIIKANILDDATAMDSLDEDASYAKIKNAFAKAANTTKTNKIIATKMIDVFASTLSK